MEPVKNQIHENFEIKEGLHNQRIKLLCQEWYLSEVKSCYLEIHG